MYRTTPISILVDVETLTSLERLAKERKLSRSAVLRDLIKEASDGKQLLIDPSPEYVTE